MANQQHPITPPPELIRKWAQYQGFESPEVLWRQIATQAARWGADQELEECCEWLFIEKLEGDNCDCPEEAAKELRAARRPKLPSLKEQALKELEWVDKNLKMPLLNQCTAIHTIRCALEQLND